MKKIVNLVVVLTVISAVCAAILATVDAVTKNQIAQIREQASQNAAREVMPPVKAIEKIKGDAYDSFIGRNAEGRAVAYAVVGRDDKGYGGAIVLMVGFTPEKKIIAFKKLEAYETPGLGMNLTLPSFADQFKGMDAASPIAVKKDGGPVEAITSATITSRAVCRAIENAAKKIDTLKR